MSSILCRFIRSFKKNWVKPQETPIVEMVYYKIKKATRRNQPNGY